MENDYGSLKKPSWVLLLIALSSALAGGCDDSTPLDVLETAEQEFSIMSTEALAIITTNDLNDESSLIGAYAAFKRQVRPTHIVTENRTYLSNGEELSAGWAEGIDLAMPPSRQSASLRADAIRTWLKNNYQSMGIKYVLLIGNPSPYSGDVPMKNFFCYKTHNNASEIDLPTDYYYSNLSYEWPVDAEGDILASVENDLGHQDLHVGRLPVYYSAGKQQYMSQMNKVLTKFMTYVSSTDTSWRKNALLSMNSHHPPPMPAGDYVPYGEAAVNNILIPNDFDYYRIYAQYSPPGCNNDPSCMLKLGDLEPSITNMGSVWAGTAWSGCAGDGCVSPKRDFGVVFWSAHGGSRSADTIINLDRAAENYSSVLDDLHPAFVVSQSCRNSLPFTEGNLGSTLLNNGAIAFLGASRYSWPGGADWTDPYVDTAGSTDVDFGFLMELIDSNLSGGEALSVARSYLWDNVLSSMDNTNSIIPAELAGQYIESFNCTLDEGGTSLGNVDHTHCYRKDDGSSWRIWNTGCGWEYGRRIASGADPSTTVWERYARTYVGDCDSITPDQLETQVLAENLNYRVDNDWGLGPNLMNVCLSDDCSSQITVLNNNEFKLGWMWQQMLFNLYGDPTVGLENETNPNVVSLPSDTPVTVTLTSGAKKVFFADNWPSKGNPWWTANIVLSFNSLTGNPIPRGTSVYVNGVRYTIGDAYYQEVNIPDLGPYTIEISSSVATTIQIQLGNR